MTSERSALKERLSAEIVQALKAGEKVRLGALRMLSASVKNREVELRREVTDDEFREVAAREVKRRTEAVEAYQAAGRTDLVEKESAERDALQTYLPEQLSAAEVAAIIDEAIEETGATTMKEMGKVMGQVMARAKGKVDGSAVQARVKERLAGTSD